MLELFFSFIQFMLIGTLILVATYKVTGKWGLSDTIIHVLVVTVVYCYVGAIWKVCLFLNATGMTQITIENGLTKFFLRLLYE